MSHVVTIQVFTDNTAFQDGDAGIELSRILGELADRAARNSDVVSLDGVNLFDVNGNSVGDVRITE